MKPDEATALVTRIFDGWPLPRFRDLAATQVLYVEQLLPYGYGAADKGVNRALAQCQRFPSIAEVLEFVREEAHDARLAADELAQRRQRREDQRLDAQRRAVEQREKGGTDGSHGA